MYWVALVTTASATFLLGFVIKDILVIVRNIHSKLLELKTAEVIKEEVKQELEPKKSSFAEPMTMADLQSLQEEELIRSLNNGV